MAVPKLNPVSTVSAIVLTSTGSTETTGKGAGNTSNYPFAIYSDTTSALYDRNFVSGASDQVAYVYKKLGGDVLDLEITPGNVYSAYEEATLEYSYIMNVHQASNVLSDYLGATTGTFDQDGQLSGSSLSGSNVNLRYPRFEFGYTKRVSLGLANEAGVAGGNLPHYSASIRLFTEQQDYDLQQIIVDNASNNSEPANGNPVPYNDIIGTGSGDINRRITVRRVYYKTPQAMWRFYGYYGGLNVVGNLNYYGQYADDTTFEIIPVWQNKLQAMAYEDHLYTRLSHYSYEIFNNKLRITPQPQASLVDFIWFEFSVDGVNDPWDKVGGIYDDEEGINNLGTLPFDNIPYKNINAIGKQWIRRYALALVKETLGQIRSKFGAIPIPGESVTLNGPALITEGREEQKELKEELKTTLAELTYPKLAEQDAAIVENVSKTLEEMPLLIYQG
tara:strand:- start:1068 stop:2408 length:1341 start_codon:yes stop_codon:yes gene_type:complete